MMNHEISELFVAYLDGALTEEEARRVGGHLRECPACRETLEDFRRTGQLLRHWTDVAPPPGLEARVLERIQARKSRGNRPWNFWNFNSPRRWAAAAAAAVLVAGAAYWAAPPFRSAPGINPADQAEIENNIDLFLNFDVITHLDTLREMEPSPRHEPGESFLVNMA